MKHRNFIHSEQFLKLEVIPTPKKHIVALHTRPDLEDAFAENEMFRLVKISLLNKISYCKKLRAHE